MPYRLRRRPLLTRTQLVFLDEAPGRGIDYYVMALDADVVTLEPLGAVAGMCQEMRLVGSSER